MSPEPGTPARLDALYRQGLVPLRRVVFVPQQHPDVVQVPEGIDLICLNGSKVRCRRNAAGKGLHSLQALTCARETRRTFAVVVQGCSSSILVCTPAAASLSLLLEAQHSYAASARRSMPSTSVHGQAAGLPPGRHRSIQKGAV